MPAKYHLQSGKEPSKYDHDPVMRHPTDHLPEIDSVDLSCLEISTELLKRLFGPLPEKPTYTSSRGRKPNDLHPYLPREESNNRRNPTFDLL